MKPYIYFIMYLAVINIVAFLMYGVDKRRAVRHMWRIPESTLIGIAVVGGSIGAVCAVRVFRHKTRHMKFTVGLPLILILQVSLLAVAVYYLL